MDPSTIYPAPVKAEASAAATSSAEYEESCIRAESLVATTAAATSAPSESRDGDLNQPKCNSDNEIASFVNKEQNGITASNNEVTSEATSNNYALGRQTSIDEFMDANSRDWDEDYTSHFSNTSYSSVGNISKSSKTSIDKNNKSVVKSDNASSAPLNASSFADMSVFSASQDSVESTSNLTAKSTSSKTESNEMGTQSIAEEHIGATMISNPDICEYLLADCVPSTDTNTRSRTSRAYRRSAKRTSRATSVTTAATAEDDTSNHTPTPPAAITTRVASSIRPRKYSPPNSSSQPDESIASLCQSGDVSTNPPTLIPETQEEAAAQLLKSIALVNAISSGTFSGTLSKKMVAYGGEEEESSGSGLLPPLFEQNSIMSDKTVLADTLTTVSTASCSSGSASGGGGSFDDNDGTVISLYSAANTEIMRVTDVAVQVTTKEEEEDKNNDIIRKGLELTETMEKINSETDDNIIISISAEEEGEEVDDDMVLKIMQDLEKANALLDAEEIVKKDSTRVMSLGRTRTSPANLIPVSLVTSASGILDDSQRVIRASASTLDNSYHSLRGTFSFSKMSSMSASTSKRFFGIKSKKMNSRKSSIDESVLQVSVIEDLEDDSEIELAYGSVPLSPIKDDSTTTSIDIAMKGEKMSSDGSKCGSTNTDNTDNISVDNNDHEVEVDSKEGINMDEEGDDNALNIEVVQEDGIAHIVYYKNGRFTLDAPEEEADDDEGTGEEPRAGLMEKLFACGDAPCRCDISDNVDPSIALYEDEVNQLHDIEIYEDDDNNVTIIGSNFGSAAKSKLVLQQQPRPGEKVNVCVDVNEMKVSQSGKEFSNVEDTSRNALLKTRADDALEFEVLSNKREKQYFVTDSSTSTTNVRDDAPPHKLDAMNSKSTSPHKLENTRSDSGLLKSKNIGGGIHMKKFLIRLRKKKKHD